MVDVYVAGKNHKFCKHVQLFKGSVIGQISFYLNTKRTATIINSGYNKLFFLEKQNSELLQLRLRDSEVKLCENIVSKVRVNFFI